MLLLGANAAGAQGAHLVHDAIQFCKVGVQLGCLRVFLLQGSRCRICRLVTPVASSRPLTISAPK